jgi:hypothetical protein
VRATGYVIEFLGFASHRPLGNRLAGEQLCCCPEVEPAAWAMQPNPPSYLPERGRQAVRLLFRALHPFSYVFIPDCVGVKTVAADTAEIIYAPALTLIGFFHDGVHRCFPIGSGLPALTIAILKLCPQPSQSRRKMTLIITAPSFDCCLNARFVCLRQCFSQFAQLPATPQAPEMSFCFKNAAGHPELPLRLILELTDTAHVAPY